MIKSIVCFRCEEGDVFLGGIKGLNRSGEISDLPTVKTRRSWPMVSCFTRLLYSFFQSRTRLFIPFSRALAINRKTAVVLPEPDRPATSVC